MPPNEYHPNFLTTQSGNQTIISSKVPPKELEQARQRLRNTAFAGIIIGSAALALFCAVWPNMLSAKGEMGAVAGYGAIMAFFLVPFLIVTSLLGIVFASVIGIDMKTFRLTRMRLGFSGSNALNVWGKVGIILCLAPILELILVFMFL